MSSKKVKVMFFLLTATVSLSSFANDIYFTKDRMNRFACRVAQSMKVAYPNKTLRNFRVEILDILRQDINPWVDAYPIPAGFSLPKFVEKATGFPGFPMDRSEYYLQNAFILYGNREMELKEPTENYFASFIHLARSRHIDYLNGKAGKFQLRKETNLLQQIEEHLPAVANNSYPYLDIDGLPIMQKKEGVKEKNLYKLAIGNPSHKTYNQFVDESQKYNHFSTPLFMWLLEQKDFSVTPEKLYDKALEIYGNPIVALGVIPWIFSGDALTVDRRTSSVVSYKIERLVEGDDIPGLQYHFWGYLTQGIIGNKNRVGALAYIYEKLYQKDIQDWTVDALSLKTGEKIRSAYKNPDQCATLL
ncbi:MAG: hypothetical protein K2Q18_18135 [Bdellovibrionales bacterium]|nr:hypothetical protein [Bdellovibrionales bacterium]